MKIGVHFKQHFHSGMDGLTCYSFKIGPYHHPFVFPTLGRSLGNRGMCLFIFLNQFHVAMASHLAGFGQFCLNPILVRHDSLQCQAYKIVEFI